MVRIGAATFPLFLKGRQLLLFRYEATYRFAYATTRRIAHLPNGDFVRKLDASGLPCRLSQATWVNCRIPPTGLAPVSYTVFTAYRKIEKLSLTIVSKI